MSTHDWDPWSYRESVPRDNTASGLKNYTVHASDGDIGKVDEATDEVGKASIVVDTGPWIFGRKVILPAGVIERVDDKTSSIHVSLTRDQIRDSPELDESNRDDSSHREALGAYYGGFHGGLADPLDRPHLP